MCLLGIIHTSGRREVKLSVFYYPPTIPLLAAEAAAGGVHIPQQELYPLSLLAGATKHNPFK